MIEASMYQKENKPIKEKSRKDKSKSKGEK